MPPGGYMWATGSAAMIVGATNCAELTRHGRRAAAYVRRPANPGGFTRNVAYRQSVKQRHPVNLSCVNVALTGGD